MASVFPYTNGTATTDSFSDPLSTSPLNSPSHSQLHQDINTAVETIESVLQSGGGSRNVLYNGAMQVAQRGTSTASITTTGYYTADRWRIDISSLGTWTSSIENDAPTGSGFRKSAKVLCTTADASPAAGDYLFWQQRIEGQDLQAFRKGTSAAQQFTVSFWVKANVTGTYVLFLFDNDNSRSVSKTYTISSSATWEFKTLTFAADTTGVFDNDNLASLDLWWFLGVGSSWTSGTRNETWASYVQGNSGQGQTVNLASATNNYWQVTGVQLNVGGVAAPFEFKSYERELRECQRYYYRRTATATSEMIITGFQPANTNIAATGFHPVVMRATPSSSAFGGTWSAVNSAAGPLTSNPGTNALNVYITVNGGIGNTNQSARYSEIGAYIEVNAEL